MPEWQVEVTRMPGKVTWQRGFIPEAPRVVETTAPGASVRTGRVRQPTPPDTALFFCEDRVAGKIV